MGGWGRASNNPKGLLGNNSDASGKTVRLSLPDCKAVPSVKEKHVDEFRIKHRICQRFQQTMSILSYEVLSTQFSQVFIPLNFHFISPCTKPFGDHYSCRSSEQPDSFDRVLGP